MLLIKYFKNSELQKKTRKPVLHVKNPVRQCRPVKVFQLSLGCMQWFPLWWLWS